MKKLLLFPVLAVSVFVNTPAKAWDVNNWMDRQDARTCTQLVQTAGYYMSKGYATGNSQFKKLANDTIAKAQRQGCR
jgi:hypothetical protein